MNIVLKLKIYTFIFLIINLLFSVVISKESEIVVNNLVEDKNNKTNLFSSDLNGNGIVYLYNPAINDEKYKMLSSEFKAINSNMKSEYNIGGQDLSVVDTDIVMAFQAKDRNQQYKWDFFLQVVGSTK